MTSAIRANSGSFRSSSWASGAEPVLQPWNHTGLLRFRLFGNSAQDANLMKGDALVAIGIDGPFSRESDREARTARSILFPRGEVYSNDGRFWLRRADGSTLMVE
jgi:hypothetical protein